MDPISQIVLGASVSEAIAGKYAKNKAVLWGAICAIIPDLDIFFIDHLNVVDRTLAHRGFSHSILFFVLLSPVLGYIIKKIHKNLPLSHLKWTLLVFMALFTHALLDCCTTWGTSLFWPLEMRVSFNNIFVIDPLYTLPFALFLIMAIFQKKNMKKRRLFNNIALTISSFYIMITFINKTIVNEHFSNIFKKKGLNITRFETTPTPLNNILWTTYAETNKGYYIGYYSLFDSKNGKLQYFPKQNYLLKPYIECEGVKKLKFLTKGYYTVKENDRGIILNDLRFGRMKNWETNRGKFTFKYSISKNKKGNCHIKKTRDSESINKKMLYSFWNRIKGI